MVDVFKIKKGDTVKFRNGEIHTVVEAKTYEDYGYEYGEDWEKKQFLVIWIDRNLGGRVDFTYGNFGGSYYSTGQSGWDIVEHIPTKENNMIYVNDFKVGDTVVLRDGTTGTVEEISKYEKGFGLHLSCFPGKELGCYSSGWQKNFYESKYDIVEHIPAEEDNMISNKKVRFGGHQPRQRLHSSDKRPDPSQQSAAVEPTQSAVVEPTQDEMTMRDQFAMSAMNGILIGDENWHSTSPKELSELSYVLADEMMKARKVNN